MEEIIVSFLAISAGISVLMTTVKKWLPSSTWLNRLLPVIPLIGGSVAGAFAFADPSMIVNVALGLLAGSFAGHSYKVFKQTIQGE